MCGTSDTCSTLSEYLSTSTEEEGGELMMKSKLQSYFFWKAAVGKMHRNLKSYLRNRPKARQAAAKQGEVIPTSEGAFESAAMKRKREYQRRQAPSGKRRRVRGGGAVRSSPGGAGSSAKVFVSNTGADADALEADTTAFADLYVFFFL